MEDFSKYVKWKLGIKLNLILSEGKKTEGVINENILNILVGLVSDYGLYEIITHPTIFFPTSIRKIEQDTIRNTDSRKYISFELREFRSMKLRELEI